MTVEAELAALTDQTTQLLDVVFQLKSGVAAQIAAAVLLSENATQIPLINISTTFIKSQTDFINYVGQRP
jgi:hypothetical protein